MPWKVFQDSGKYAIHKMNPDGSKGEMIPPAYDSAEEAQARVKALFAEAVTERMSSDRIYDAFVTTQPGTAYRLLPFGQIKRAKGGAIHELTPETAAKFRLPHFRPPVKMGSHEDTTPAGGHIIGLEVRQDGLYAIPEWTDKGQQAVTDGNYRYHSPEIIWDDGAIENATTGEWITGPLIVGDALLHTPALGEATALYTSQYQSNEGAIMSEETVQVPKGLMEQLTALFKPVVKAAEQTATVTIPEEYTAAVAERDQLKAQIAQIEADKLRVETVTRLGADLRSDKFGQEFAGTAAEDAASVLAGMTGEQAGWVMTRLAAMSKRIDYSAVTAEMGTDGANTITDPRQAFAAAVESKMKGTKMSYQDAYALVKNEAPDLFAAYAAHVPGKGKE